MTPLPLEALRAVAKANNSVNTHLADYFSLRWHDPFWLAVWQEYRSTKAVWDRTWKSLDFAYMKPVEGSNDSVQWPDFTAIPEGHPARSLCEAYMAAKGRYLSALDHYAYD